MIADKAGKFKYLSNIVFWFIFMDSIKHENTFLDFAHFNIIFYVKNLFFSGKANSVEEASKMLVTAAFTRHPFHRLVSAYRDKIARRNTRFFTPIRKHIIETYRKRLDLMKSHQGK